MKAEEFYKQRSNSIRELWALSPKQIEYIGLIMEEYAALCQPPVMVRSEQLPCSHCGRPLKEHSKDSKLCPDRMKNFEQGN